MNRLLDLLPEATAHSNVHGYLFTDEQMLDFARAAINAFASNAGARLLCDDECVTHCPDGCPHAAPTSAALSERLAGRPRKPIDPSDIGAPYFPSDYEGGT